MTRELPPRFLDLIHAKRWRHPGDEALRLLIPFIRDPMEFLQSEAEIDRESFCHSADDPRFADILKEYRSSTTGESRELPWRDVERSVIVAVNRNLGDDVAIALDLRTSDDDPRVIATDWTVDPKGCHWRLVAEHLSVFIQRLESASAEEKTEAQSGATDNPDDARRLREDH